MESTIWTPVEVGRIKLGHRLAMAPMTRSRAGVGGVPTELNAEYYAQRAELGLLISEGTQPSHEGQGYLATPGIHTPEQSRGWRLVSDAVHQAGGHLYIQLMHAGRIGHPDNNPLGLHPVGPSAVRAQFTIHTPTGIQEMIVPNALSSSDIARTVDDFRYASRLAIESGGDGVELHGANGYLIHQFLAENSNHRLDEFGGSIANRTRFAVQVAEAVADEIGPERTGMRISPGNPFNDIDEGDTHTLYQHLVPKLADIGLAYLHVMHFGDDELLQWIRSVWPTTLIVNRVGRPIEELGRDVEIGLADIASIGSYALSNPDFVTRLQAGGPLNEPDVATFYGGGPVGYTDYPTLAPSKLSRTSSGHQSTSNL